MKTKLIIVCGAKGGTGKSTFLRYLITWLQEAGVAPFIIDADDENSTTARYFKEALKIVPSRVKSNDVIVDIAEKGEHPVIIVDLKAGTGKMMLNWVADVPFEELKAIGVSIVAVGAITSSPDSTSSFLNWVNFLGKRVKYLVVRNLKDSDAWEQKPEDVLFPEYDQTREALEFRKLYKPVEIVMPALDPEYQSELERLNLTIRDVLAKHPNTPPALNSLIVRSKLRNYQAWLFESFAAHKDLLLP
ncbi:MAG: division plane positioning ATPase MipZ [Chthoniobacter sp.]|nr:division plane positioning ATPase MipZ [Chthoniobacter sp.]